MGALAFAFERSADGFADVPREFVFLWRVWRGGEVEWRVGRGVEVVDRGHVVRSEGGSAVGIGGSVHGLAPAVVVGGFLRCVVLVPGGAVVR